MVLNIEHNGELITASLVLGRRDLSAALGVELSAEQVQAALSELEIREAMRNCRGHRGGGGGGGGNERPRKRR
jgi:hypothetical protein